MLKESNLSNKIVFASSNTKEYCKERKFKEQILEELSKYNSDIVTNITHGYQLVKDKVL